MGTRAFINEPPRHVSGVRPRFALVPTQPPYDWVDEITPEVFRWALSAVIGYAATAEDGRIREAARCVEARVKRAQARGADWCNPFGMPRPS